MLFLPVGVMWVPQGTCTSPQATGLVGKAQPGDGQLKALYRSTRGRVATAQFRSSCTLDSSRPSASHCQPALPPFRPPTCCLLLTARGLPEATPSLKDLAKLLLQLQMREGGAGAHDSREDAAVSMRVRAAAAARVVPAGAGGRGMGCCGNEAGAFSCTGGGQDASLRQSPCVDGPLACSLPCRFSPNPTALTPKPYSSITCPRFSLGWYLQPPPPTPRLRLQSSVHPVPLFQTSLQPHPHTHAS